MAAAKSAKLQERTSGAEAQAQVSTT